MWCRKITNLFIRIFRKFIAAAISIPRKEVEIFQFDNCLYNGIDWRRRALFLITLMVSAFSPAAAHRLHGVFRCKPADVDETDYQSDWRMGRLHSMDTYVAHP